MTSSREPRDAWLHGLAGNPSAPASVLVRLLRMAPERQLPYALMLRPLPAEVVEAWLRHPDRRTRRSLCEQHHLTPEQRGRLLDGDDPRIAFIVATVAADEGRALTEDAFERLATHPDSNARCEAARHRDLPRRLRHALAADPHPAVRRSVCRWGWAELDAGLRAALVADEDDGVRSEALLSRHRELPMDPHIHASLPEEAVRQQAARECRLTSELAELLVTHEDAGIRAGVAENPHLAADLVVRLGEDPDERVRFNAAQHPSLDEDQRAAIPVEISPDLRYWPLDWVLARRDDPEEMRRCATSGHVLLRRGAALAKELPPDVVELLARDEDHVVRLLLAESCAQAPGELLLEMWRTWNGWSRFEMPRHPNFPRRGLLRYADDPDPRMRELARLDPESTAEVVERLGRDPEPTVRYAALGDVRLSPESVVRLTTDAQEEVRERAAADSRLPREVLARLLEAPGTAGAAAANPVLPVAVMHDLLDRAGLP
ncbi:PE-PGRS family protein [Streptomyces sp. NPDC013953]|uniref:PE-PGRS family protein n=1 Tax=Streptomyces sp. NPDC013953 TaxID=3364868 RepID=UPI003700CF94